MKWLNGKDFWLEVYRSLETGESEVLFKDLTNGDTTYGGGRYVRLNKESDGSYIIDFNKLSKKPLKKVVSSANAKRLSNSEIEKIIQFGINNNDL